MTIAFIIHHENIRFTDIVKERRDIVEADFPDVHMYRRVEDMLDDPEIDLVTIAIPNDMHKETAIRAMRAGKNVGCEKPVTLNAGEMEEIIAVRNETGKLFSVHQNRRWDRDFRIVKEAKERGLLGQLTFVESKVQGSRGSMYGWRGYKRNGGGMLLDWVCI